jgi:hypothetical protein
LQIFKLGSVREGREAPEPELLAEPEQRHDWFQTVNS